MAGGGEGVSSRASTVEQTDWLASLTLHVDHRAGSSLHGYALYTYDIYSYGPANHGLIDSSCGLLHTLLSGSKHNCSNFLATAKPSLQFEYNNALTMQNVMSIVTLISC